MLELRLKADRKRIGAMRAAITRECRRANTGAAHGEAVAQLAAELVTGDGEAGSGRRVLVVVTVQSDVTILMVRETGVVTRALGPERERLLASLTTCWSTISGCDDRTIWAEVARSPESDEPAAAAVAAIAPSRPERVRVGSRRSRSVFARPGVRLPCAP